ncbi:MAG TPA: hypothetical protein VGQ76_23810 [Thermoanaerobaculia bacterium]|nr:hypothetical protein [Thermoanaerobaculia bacterium]
MVAAILLIWFHGVLTGVEQFFFRDLGTTHLPSAALFSDLGFAKQNPYASFGQPYVGNPNLVIGYRSALTWLSPSVYLLLHLVWGAIGMFQLLRTNARSPDAAFVGALVFSTSGYALSSLSFMNATTTIAWAPWVLFVASTGAAATLRQFILTTAVLGVFTITGEPSLIAMTLALAILIAFTGKHGWLFAVALATGVALSSPLHLMTLSTAKESARVLTGYRAYQALSQSMHPARVVESLLPGVFGSPSHLVAGAWWGFGVSDNAAPYLHSVAFGLIPLAMIAIAAAAGELREHKGWLVLFVAATTLSFMGNIPGAGTLYDAFAPLHVVRYPIKALFLSVIALAVLSAVAFDSVGRVRRRVTSCAVAAAVMFTTAVAVGLLRNAVVSALVRFGWNNSWRSRPDEVLVPIVAAIPWHLVIVGIGFVALLWFGRSGSRAAAVLVMLVMFAERARDLRNQLPTVSTRAVAQMSSFVRAAVALNGRVFERAGKELDPVRRGLYGRYPSDHTQGLALAQAAQGWQLSAAPKGLRYAYDASPDGSYTYRNQIVQNALDRNRDWTYRLKWLRASAVRGIITPNLPYGHPGLELVAEDSSIGIPQRLYRITDTLEEYRRVSNVEWATSATDALRRFESLNASEPVSVVLEGTPVATDVHHAGAAIATSVTPRQLEIRTTGSGRAILFVSRTYTTDVEAWVNGVRGSVRPANVHLIGIPVPPGTSYVVVRF